MSIQFFINFLICLSLFFCSSSGKKDSATETKPISQVKVSSEYWKVEYFSNIYLSGNPVGVEEEYSKEINHQFKEEGYFGAKYNYSVRWTRTLQLVSPSFLILSSRSDDGIKVYIDNSLVQSKWIDRGAGNFEDTNIFLQAGSHTIKVEYYQKEGGAVCQFKWKTESANNLKNLIGSLKIPDKNITLDEIGIFAFNLETNNIYSAQINGNNFELNLPSGDYRISYFAFGIGLKEEGFYKSNDKSVTEISSAAYLEVKEGIAPIVFPMIGLSGKELDASKSEYAKLLINKASSYKAGEEKVYVRKQINDALKISSDNKEVLYLAGKLYFEIRKENNLAFEFWEKAEKQGYKSIDMFTALANNYAFALEETKARNYAKKTKESYKEKIEKELSGVADQMIDKIIETRINYAYYLESVNFFEDGIDQIKEILKEKPSIKHSGFIDIASKLGIWHGHSALLKNDYPLALARYKWARDLRKHDPNNKENLSLEHFIEAVTHVIQTGIKKDAYIHKCAGVFFPRTSIHMVDNGKQVDIETTTTYLMKERQIFLQAGLKLILEHFSDGGFTLDFKNFDTNSGKTKTSGFDDLDPEIGELFHQLSKEYDTILPYWNRNTFESYGGSQDYPAIPGHYYTPTRGFVMNSANWCDAYGENIMLHEFFHNVEHMTGISPTHGADPIIRKNFPNWKGKDEYDYIKWHFATTIKKKPWSELNYKARFNSLWPDHFYKAVREKAMQYKLSDRIESKALSDKGWEEWNKNKNEASATKYMKEAIHIYPLRYEALRFFADRAWDKKNYDSAMGYFQKYWEVKYDPNLYLSLANDFMWGVRNREKARDIYLLFLKNFPKDPEEGKFQVYLGRAYEELKEYENAKKFYLKAVADNPNHPAVGHGCFRLAVIYNEVEKNKAVASKWLEESIKKGNGKESLDYKTQQGF